MNKIKKNKFIMLVGLPGSGKSYEAERLNKLYENAVILSSDKIREEVLGDINDQSNNKLVFKLMEQYTVLNLSKGKTVIYDSTNISRKRRMEFLDKIKDIDCMKECYLVLTDYHVCLENNSKRDRQVPTGVIDRMYMQFEIPQKREGWDNIDITWNWKYNKNYDIGDLMDNLKKIPHNDKFHTRTIGNHIWAVTKEITRSCCNVLSSEELSRLQEVAFYHDIGKPFCTTVDKNGVTLYPCHANVSAYLYLLYKGYNMTLSTLCDISPVEYEEELEEWLYRADLIENHMKMYDINTEEGLEELKSELGEDKIMELSILHKADKEF